MQSFILLACIIIKKKSQLMELGPQPTEKEPDNNLKAQREAATPGQDNWQESESDKSSLEEDNDVEDKILPIQLSKEDQAEGSQQKVQEGKKRAQREWKLFQHYVDEQYLILLIVLRRQRLINIVKLSGLKEGSISLLGKQGKIIVRASDRQAGQMAINNLSSYIDRLNIQKTSNKREAASRIANFRKLKDELSKDGITTFGIGKKDQYDLFIGGQKKPSELRTHLQKVNQIRVQTVFLRGYHHKRSYRIIIDEILKTKYMQDVLIALNQVRFIEVDRRNASRELRLVLGSYAKKQLTPPEYETFLMKHIARFYVITFCFESEQKYLEKLKCQGISFVFVKERKFNRSYVFIIGLKEEFLKRSNEIADELSKIGDKIMGIRFFKKLQPQITSFKFDKEKEKYHLYRFPPQRPYSTVVTAHRKEGNQFKWKEVFEEIIALQ